jgi:phosphoribosyl-ATP pyrophosphohydrolase/phosphoribosyl-AMP cyclohydrolase
MPLDKNHSGPLGADLQPDFQKMPDGLIPAIVQDSHTLKVLMLGYMNEAALEETQLSGLVTFFSRTKGRLWTKGETSGNVLRVVSIRVDCDADALLIMAHPTGPVCHTGADTCWQEKNEDSKAVLAQIENQIHARKNADPQHSYTARLFADGIAQMAQKVGEEAVETLIEALGDDKERLLNESADLIFHLLVLLAAKNCTFKEVEQMLLARMK